jgi:hypothetical protein
LQPASLCTSIPISPPPHFTSLLSQYSCAHIS